MFSARRAFILSIFLVGVCYVNSLPNDFVFDDGPMVSLNPAIRVISPIRFLTSPYWAKQQYLGIYRPFTIFSLSVDYAIWKRWAPGFRLTNLAVHAINGGLVFLLCENIVGPGIVPLVTMIIWVVHPLHTEAVTSIVGRSELFSACFFMAAWLLFRRGRSLWAAIAFFFALLSKENAIVLPAVLLLDLRLRPSHEGRRWLRLAPVTAAALAYLGLRLYVLGALGIPVAAQYIAGHLKYVDRLLTSGRVFIQYLKLIVFPLNLAGDYDFNAIPIARSTDWDAWIGLLLIAAVAAVAWRYRRRKWALSFGLFFSLIALLPSSNWAVPISILMAERFLYLPLVGVSLAAAVVYCEPHEPRVRRLIGGGALLTSMVLCNSHDYIRRNDFAFFKNMVRVVPDSGKARLGYGFALIQKGRNEEAERELEAGLRIMPDYPELLSTLALAKITSTGCAEAWPLLKRAVEIDPGHADTHRRMGDCYFKEGRIREAESMYRQALASIPSPDAMLYFIWGRSLEEIGDSTPAIAAYQRAALIDPDNAFIRQKLASLGTARSGKLKQ